MSYLYFYIENEKKNDAVKYGMKLSEHANKIIHLSNNKKGLICYLTPGDSPFFGDKNFTCLKINAKNLNVFVYNKIFEDTDKLEDYFVKFEDYILGSFEEPVALICSTILPENILIYNEIIDTPTIIENSKEFYYERAIQEMLSTEAFTSYELYQMLLILGKQKNIFEVSDVTEKIKIYKSNLNEKTYTKKSNF